MTAKVDLIVKLLIFLVATLFVATHSSYIIAQENENNSDINENFDENFDEEEDEEKDEEKEEKNTDKNAAEDQAGTKEIEKKAANENKQNVDGEEDSKGKEAEQKEENQEKANKASNEEKNHENKNAANDGKEDKDKSKKRKKPPLQSKEDVDKNAEDAELAINNLKECREKIKDEYLRPYSTDTKKIILRRIKMECKRLKKAVSASEKSCRRYVLLKAKKANFKRGFKLCRKMIRRLTERPTTKDGCFTRPCDLAKNGEKCAKNWSNNGGVGEKFCRRWIAFRECSAKSKHSRKFPDHIRWKVEKKSGIIKCRLPLKKRKTTA